MIFLPLGLNMSAFTLSGDKLVMKQTFVCLAGIGFIFGLNLLGAPLIVSPQASTTNRVSLGSTVVLAVSATSPASEILYQWALGTNDVPAATNASLSINNVRTNQAGVYTVRATDVDGTVTSPGMTLLIGPTFTRITNEPFSSGGGAQGISWGDVNGDGGWMFTRPPAAVPSPLCLPIMAKAPSLGPAKG